MTDAYRNNAEEQGAKVSGAGVTNDVSGRVIAREKDAAPGSQISSSKVETGEKHTTSEAEELRKSLHLMHGVSKTVTSFQYLSQMVVQVTQMTQQMLNAAASSVLLLDSENHDFIVEAAIGPVGKQLRTARISAQHGIAGWVVRHGEPLIINDVSKDERFSGVVDAFTGFATKSIICAPLVAQRKVIGVIEVLNKLDGTVFSEHDLKTLIPLASTAAMAINNAKLQQGILESYKTTIKVLSAAVDARDPYACGHSQRVADYVMLGANSMPFSGDEREVLECAAILHDIGKVYIPERILVKPGPLDSEESRLMLKHPALGANMLKQIPFLVKASKLVLYHHERYDGNGYPEGLKGEAIPIGSRLIAVADAFDTMSTCHSYRGASTIDHAIEKLRRLSGMQFCPISVQVFIAGFAKFHFHAKSQGVTR